MFCCTSSFPIIPRAQHWMQVSQMVQLHPTKGFLPSFFFFSEPGIFSLNSKKKTRSLGWNWLSCVKSLLQLSPVYQHRFLLLLLLLVWICQYFISRSLICVFWGGKWENDSVPLTLWAWLWEGGEAPRNLCLKFMFKRVWSIWNSKHFCGFFHLG